MGYLLLSCLANGAAIWLDTNPPLPLLDPAPSEVITVLVKTDAPLLALTLKICVTGNATIIDAMNATDGGAYGWNVSYVPLSIINPDNSVEMYGVQFGTNTHTTVGYFRMYRNSGVVKVKIDLGFSQAFNWTQTEFEFDPTTLYIGSIPAVEIYSDITVNQVWTADKAYYITSNPSDPNIQTINVQALLVIEPGTTVIYGANACLAVNNGGTLIANGTPDKPIFFTPDYLYYLYPDSIGYYWLSIFTESVYYQCPIYVESTASTATTIRYCMMEGAVSGVVIQNIRLANPIENNYFVGNGWGVFEQGPRLTDISNNLFFCNSRDGIEVFFIPDPNTTADMSHSLNITGNTCDYNQFVGITVHGVQDPNNIPTVNLTNNIVTYHGGYGLNLVDYYMDARVENTGYCGNVNNTNWDFEQSNPIVTDVYPYTPIVAFGPFEGGPLAHHYLASDSVFVNGGTELAVNTPFIGMTTQGNGATDKDLLDLGFHVLNWTYEGSEVIDETGLFDLVIMAKHWMSWTPYEPNSPGYIDPNSPGYDPNDVSFGGDWNKDGHIDYNDFVLMAGIWRKGFTQPNLAPVIEGDPDEGFVTVSASGYSPETQTIFAYVNGEYLGRVYEGGVVMPQWVDLSETGPLSRLKFLVISNKGYYYYSALSDIPYTSPLSYCIVPERYEPNEPIPFAAINTGTGNTTVSVFGDEDYDQPIWSQTFTGNTISGIIPANILTGRLRIESVRFTPAGGTGVIKTTSANPGINIDIVEPLIEALLLFPDERLKDLDSSRTLADTAFFERGIPRLWLVDKDCTYERVSRWVREGNVRYIYYGGHGLYSADIVSLSGIKKVLRTQTVLYDGPVYSCKRSDFPNPPHWCEELEPSKELNGKTWGAMNPNKLQLFWNEGCYGGRVHVDETGHLAESEPGFKGLVLDTPSDMTLALRMHNFFYPQCYFGWVPAVPTGRKKARPPLSDEKASYGEFSEDVWTSLSLPANSVFDALNTAVSMTHSQRLDSAICNFRISGSDFTNVRLTH